MSFAKALKPYFPLTLRARLTLLYVLIFGTTTLIFNAFLLFQTKETLQNDFDDALYNYAIDVSQSIHIGPRGDLTFPPLQVDDGKILPFPLGTALIQVTARDGEALSKLGQFGDWSPPFKEAFRQLDRGVESHFQYLDLTDQIPTSEAKAYRLVSFPLGEEPLPELILQIAVPMTLIETQLSQRLRTLILGFPAVLLISILAGAFLSRRALRPVDQMTQAAASIDDASDLGQRIPVPRAEDEIRRLSLTLNQMLERIEKAFQSQERFIADASHQLLTPLSVLKADLEHLRKRENPDSEHLKEFIESSHQEIENLTQVLKGMLVLARIDSGLAALTLSEIHLDEVVMEAVARTERVAAQKQVRLIPDFQNENDRASFRGDAELLTTLFANILENAVKYSPPRSIVRISLIWSPTRQEVEIRDQGAGFQTTDIPRIFERFARAPDAAQKAQGFGLGLAISQKIAFLHGAQLTARNHEQGGACFKFQMALPSGRKVLPKEA